MVVLLLGQVTPARMVGVSWRGDAAAKHDAGAVAATSTAASLSAGDGMLLAQAVPAAAATQPDSEDRPAAEGGARARAAAAPAGPRSAAAGRTQVVAMLTYRQLSRKYRAPPTQDGREETFLAMRIHF
eukprot:COSAG06_NODE_477_length_15216_cov_133.572402_14_plen_128_part_00